MEVMGPVMEMRGMATEMGEVGKGTMIHSLPPSLSLVPTAHKKREREREREKAPGGGDGGGGG